MGGTVHRCWRAVWVVIVLTSLRLPQSMSMLLLTGLLEAGWQSTGWSQAAAAWAHVVHEQCGMHLNRSRLQFPPEFV